MSDGIDGRNSSVQPLDPRNHVQKVRETERKAPEAEFKKIVESADPDIKVRRESAEAAERLKARGARDGDKENKNEREDARKVAAVASPAVIVNAPDSVARHDQNADGRIDQLEQRNAIRAESENTTYHALSQYRRALNFSSEGIAAISTEEHAAETTAHKISAEPEDGKLFDRGEEPAKKLYSGEDGKEKKLFADDPEAKKIFAEEVAGAEKLSEKQIETLKKIYSEEELATILGESALSGEGEDEAAGDSADSVEIIV